MKNYLNTKKKLDTNSIRIGSCRQHSADQIILLLGSANYSEVYFSNGKKIIVAITLKQLEKRFSLSGDFFRTHKSYLINVKYIKDTNSLHTNEYIEMKNNFRVAVSRRKRVAFEKRIKELNA